MKQYLVRIESEAIPESVHYFPPFSLAFSEPLSFRELTRLKDLLKERDSGSIERGITRALRSLREEFSLQGQLVNDTVSAKLLV